MLFFSPQISIYLANDLSIKILVTIVSLSIFFNVIWLIFDSIFVGYKEISLRSKIIIANLLLGIIVIYPLIYFLKIKGLAIYHLLSMVIVSTLFGYYLKKIIKNLHFLSKIDYGFARDFFKFSLTTWISGLFLCFSLLVIRSIIVRLLGVSENGLYQATISLLTYVVMFQQSIQVYLFPRLSEIMTLDQFTIELNKGVRLFLISITPILFIIILFSYYFILLFYSNEFLPIVSLIPIASFGTYFDILQRLFSSALLATRNLKVYGSIAILSNLLFIALTIAFIPLFGIFGAILAYTIEYIITFSLYFLYMKKIFNYSLSSNIKLLISSLAIIVISLFLYKLNFFIRILSLSIPLVWLYIFLSKSELSELKNILKRMLRW